VRIDLDLRQHKAERDRPSGKAARRQRKFVLQGFVGWWECPISRLNNVQRCRADGGGMTGVIPFGISIEDAEQYREYSVYSMGETEPKNGG
jgi:hypothetical protein